MQPVPPPESDSRTLLQIWDMWEEEPLWVYMKRPKKDHFEIAVETLWSDIAGLFEFARAMEPCPTATFVHVAVAMSFCHYALQEQLGYPDSARDWPTTPRVAFANHVADSALVLISSTASWLLDVCFECEPIMVRDRDDVLWGTPANGDIARSWKEKALRRIGAEVLPPCSEFPNWQMEQQWEIVVNLFRDELRRAGGDASDPRQLDVTTASAKPFIPSPFQKFILTKLTGKALRTDALANAVGSRRKLFKPGGLKELQTQGLVDHHDRIGFYRPDAPPPEYRELLGKQRHQTGTK